MVEWICALTDSEQAKHPVSEAERQAIVKEIEAIVKANEMIFCGPGAEKLSDEAGKILLVIMLRGN